MLLWSSYGYIFSKAMIAGVKELGFPDHFRILLAVLKFMAVFALIIPQLPLYLKEWAYVGTGLFFITAIVAHAAHKDPIWLNMINVVFIGLLTVSYIYLYKLN